MLLIFYIPVWDQTVGLILLVVKQVSLSVKAERVLEETIQPQFKGDTVYFWTRLDMDLGLSESNRLNSFWTLCDVLNGGYCR